MKNIPIPTCNLVLETVNEHIIKVMHFHACLHLFEQSFLNVYVVSHNFIHLDTFLVLLTFCLSTENCLPSC